MQATRRESRHRIEVDRDRCEGYGLCELAAPELFALDDEGELIVKRIEVPEDLNEKAAAAAHDCPVAAISLIDPLKGGAKNGASSAN